MSKFFLLLAICSDFIGYKQPENSPVENQLIANIPNIEKYKFKTLRYGKFIMENEGTENFYFVFAMNATSDINNARQLIVDYAEGFLKEANALGENLTPNDIRVNIVFTNENKDRNNTIDQGLAEVRLINGIVTYSVDRKGTSNLEPIQVEPYIEAYQSVKSGQSPSLAASTLDLPQSTIEELQEEMFKKGEFLPFKMKLPEDFVFMPLHRKGKWGLSIAEWTALGKESTILDLWSQGDRDPDCTLIAQTGIIRMKFGDIIQKNENEFYASDAQIIENAKSMGVTNIKIRSLKWGPYPLKIVEGRLQNKPFAMGWIGLNTGGETILVHYIFPYNKKSYAEDWAIWEKLLTESTGITHKEFFENLDRKLRSLQTQPPKETEIKQALE